MPIPLEKITDIVPDSWRAAMAAFVNEAERSNVVLKVYGSAAMQAITGQSYMTATSDIDLLVYPVSAQDLQRALDLLVRHAACLPLDGEIVFPNGQAVAWKEWARTSSGERVLVKCLDAVALLPKSVVLSSLKEETCVS